MPLLTICPPESWNSLAQNVVAGMGKAGRQTGGTEAEAGLWRT